MESTYFRRGFGLKAEIEERLTSDYHSAVVERLRAIDKVAYVRFASVYRDFQDEGQFLAVLGGLSNDKS